MNTDTFSSLKEILDNLECDAQGNPDAVHEIRNQCEKVLYFIQHLQFSDNSAHVQLATKQALQYIHRALEEAEAYMARGIPAVNGKGNLMDICGPAHASLEIILNLDY
ncbi:hypothetical protein [Rufibacter hautae]|uniref:Uncharacterized protein n=1 Tax=Rufibacter hautae TaxID=2595005 RepID=A0A5B6TAA7_9BACT|nr:hypothetical protein [Rufibacter hautae]KAA3435934.1 hypothetical protein FOA19_23100 [Rufibacter hautae]